MSTWVIISWVLVAILTALNVVVFLKLKQASEQMMKMAFPGAKNMGEAMAQMQKMMGGMGAGGFGAGARGRGAPFPGAGAGGRTASSDAQLKAAMNMLQQMQKGQKR